MADAQAGIIEQVRKFWTGLSRAKKVALIGITASVLMGVVLVGLIGSQVRYVPLYTGLSTEDAASIVAKL